jgi:ABC-type cobalamin/Fe3+-siderophores transport system ATPase subunit
MDHSTFGVVEPNVAGKSLLMRKIAMPQDPDSGTINPDGIDAPCQNE